MYKFSLVEENLSGCIPSDVTCEEHFSPQTHVLRYEQTENKMVDVPLCETCVLELADIFAREAEKIRKRNGET